MVQRLTYKRRHSYNTKSNVVKKTKTPGGNLTLAYVGKRPNRPKCGDCGKNLPGMTAVRSREGAALKKRQRHVTRAYGGSRCANCVRTRIVRAFLIEEQKCVKQVLAEKNSQLKEKEPSSKKGAKKK